jgi:hypothetical protein
VFGLQPIPPPARPEDNKPPPAKITLAGITTFGHGPRALLKVVAPPRPGVKQEEQSLILAVGQREGEVEVLEIDDRAGKVKVDNFGTITTLDFENNGVKLASAPPPGVPVPGGLPVGIPQVLPGAVPPQPGFPVVPPVPGVFQPDRKISAARAARLGRTGAAFPTVAQ